MGKRFYEVMVRRYGESGPLLIVLHGGPAHQDRLGGLADSFKVLAPFQRGSGAEPLSVALHVADLFRLIQSLVRKSIRHWWVIRGERCLHLHTPARVRVPSAVWS